MPLSSLDQADIDRLNMQGLSCVVGNRRQARRLVQLALAAAERQQYPRGQAYAELNQCWLAYYGGEAEPAIAALQQYFHQCYDLEGGMAVAALQGAYASRRGAFAEAEQFFLLARQLAAQIPDSLHKFMLYARLGVDALNRGGTQEGPRNFLLALDIAERFGTPAHRVNSLSNLASSQHDLGNDEDAIPLLYEALDIIGTQKLRYQHTIVSANLAMCLLATGKPAEALALVEPFYEWPEDDLAIRAFLFCIAAHAAISLQQAQTALDLLQRADQYAKQAQDLEEQMHVWLVRGKLDLHAGDAATALVSLTQAHSLLSWTRNPFHRQQILRGLSDIHAQLGHWQDAYGFLQQYHAAFEAGSRSARASRVLMRNLEKEMRSLKTERDKALELQAARESENVKLEHLNRELAHQIMHVNSLQDSLKEQAMRDHLTGLYNRRHFETCLNAILHEANGDEPVAIIIIDLDFFKRINDTYGHNFGDEVLIQFARLVEGQLRGSDMVCRYGGEEFCLLLREADSLLAARKIDAIAARYRQLLIRQAPHSLSGCTFSAGIAEYPLHGAGRHELLMRADSALYAAKQAGRDRSMIAVPAI
ncbi:GGDEF domain-containing protein [Janthinobacterium psychrotolerans]|uniref:diguanylate cyclase n=1 Tax=Janthinobacterium psychrotolerans TaxID=1747903 RepID=A0A1A7C3W9_9BURK|nr:GGDEF domain-containing protein [Janthinobacterium psychrotolerans]OBV40407.1 diguanylate cyclase (GGDEF) domain-containing protein [Janthinobacterium psychrotolerans]